MIEITARVGECSRATTLVTLEKLAYGRFSDIGFVAAGKKRGFYRLRSAMAQATASPRD